MKEIAIATRDYEQWVRGFVPLNPTEIDFKHEQMRSSSFAFLRATFYRWMQVFPRTCDELNEAPKVLAVGDLHVENFGTWRDIEGRLVWGVNDFDEAAWLPYTIDLVRIAASVELATEANHLRIDIEDACEALVRGYQKALMAGGGPFVLAERHPALRRLATGELRNPVSFWAKMDALPKLKDIDNPDAKAALLASIPSQTDASEFKSRRAGLGSLGRPRFVVLADWAGGRVAREAKALSPSAAVWAGSTTDPGALLYSEIMSKSIRCQDPYTTLRGDWLIRRLAPDCSRIELAQLPVERDDLRLMEAMGAETANIHLGSHDPIQKVLDHLNAQPKKWLKKACEAMTIELRGDFKEFQRQGGGSGFGQR